MKGYWKLVGDGKKWNVKERFPKKVNIADVMGFAEFLNDDLKDLLDNDEVRSVKDVFGPIEEDQNGLIDLPSYKGEKPFRIFTKTDSQFEAYLKINVVKWFQCISRNIEREAA